MGARPQNVLLLEDDPLMQRFVSYALEDMALTLTSCNSVAQAMDALSRQSFNWILTDLMLPGESGLSFIEKISRMPEQLGSAQIVAISAGIDPGMQDTLTKLGVVRQLLKPVSVKTLQDLLKSNNTVSAAQETACGRLQAKATYFADQAVLYEKFAEQCRTQFVRDVLEGEQAIREKNCAAAHNLAHSLKSVLQLLGETEAQHCAEALESLTKSPGLSPEAERQWQALKNHLVQLSLDPRH